MTPPKLAAIAEKVLANLDADDAKRFKYVRACSSEGFISWMGAECVISVADLKALAKHAQPKRGKK